MTHEEFIEVCKNRVAVNELCYTDDVFVVWSCKTLQNSKAILSAKSKCAYLYEFTMNGDKGVIYMDSYKKINHEEYIIK